MRIPAIGLVILLSGCSSQMVTKRGSGGAYAPTNEAKGGTVKYLAQGMDSVIASRRQSAYKRMSKDCGGPYKITSETITAESGSNYVYIHYECQEAK